MLSIVSTPIGNLGDISLRAKEAIVNCSAVVCEDTRMTGKLLTLLGFPKKEYISYHSRTSKKKLNELIKRLKKGENLVLVSDAGTPGISDPGYSLVSEARKQGVKVEAVPGPSAFLVALSVSGLPINRFTYLGFLPLKKGRKKILESIKDECHTVVFYESPKRIEKTLKDINDLLDDQPSRFLVICRELTKMHEEVIGTTVGCMMDDLEDMTIKGEFCVVIGPK